MAEPPLMFLRDAMLTFGGTPLFSGLGVSVMPRDRACLVGRNGSGKSTLLKVLAGQLDLDGGARFVKPGTRVAYLPQDPLLPEGVSVADYVAADLPPEQAHRAEIMLHAVDLNGGRAAATLSGGEGRRAALARVLAGEPDVLLLDEPTNHLDMPTIRWLEEELARFAGAVVVISHDRAFLRSLTRRLLWLDRGSLRERDGGFATFEAWQEEVMAAEEKELERLDVKLAEETRWLHRGVTARRKRNMGRLRALGDLRSERAARAGALASRQVQMGADSGESSGKLVIEAEDIHKAYGDTVIARDFSTRILRGDRVGLIGPNGAGKTTLLKMLTGEIEPDAGSVRLGTNLSPAVFDQKRAALRGEDTLWEALCETGGDSITMQGRPRHVVSYLRDFLFDERQARMPVSALSGGERNRLLLAKILARPSNLLVLDEPTNDLDMETLDLLQEMLSDYEGTLLLVSHDRDFLDRLVTSVIAVEGDGRIEEHVGGYSDYLRHTATAQSAGAKTETTAPPAADKKTAPRPRPARSKLGYKEQRELDQLPARIETLQSEIAQLEKRLADPTFYGRDPDGFARASAELEQRKTALEQAEERWLALEMQREALSEGG